MGVAIATLGLLVALGAAGWPGMETGASGSSFCEASRPGPVKQPANTYSNAAFYLVGLAIGWRAWRDVASRKRASWRNPVVTTVAYPASIAVCSILIGAGSTALHASTTRLGAELDHLAMHVWGAWMVAYAATRLFRLGDREFFGLWGAQALTLATRAALGRPDAVPGSALFGTMVGLAVAIELVGRWRNHGRRRMDTTYLGWAIGTFLAGYACYTVSGNEGPWCEPTSPWQGHAAWHVLCAGSTAFVYLYLRSEREAGSVMDSSIRASVRN